MAKEVRQSGNKPSTECSLQGCKKTQITIRLQTYRDDGKPDREAQFCTDAHAATWLISYGLREKAGWKEGVPNQATVDGIEGMVNELITDKYNIK